MTSPEPDTSLLIHYHDPEAYFDFTVDYDFGSGYVTIDDLYDGRRDENIPYENVYQYGNTVEVTAHNQQGGDYFRVFEKWIRNIGTKQQESINDSVSSCEVTDSVKYEGSFNRRFDFTAENDFTTGGEGGELIVDGISEEAPYSRYFVETRDEPFEIEAPDQTIKVNERNVDYYFLNWSDNIDTNPRTFSPNDHDSIKAIYKGHLASNKARATGYNNGRRITSLSNGELHAVYEDNDKIWYTRSANDGETWSPEVCISFDAPGYTGHYNPSICALDEKIYVVWESVTDNNYSDYMHEVSLRIGDVTGETTTWFDTEIVAFNDGDIMTVGTDEARPVVCVNSKEGVFIAWRSNPPETSSGSYDGIDTRNNIIIAVGECGSKARIIKMHRGD